ncbi:MULTISPECIES: NmrA family NAD(P)-binding protein [unclassified Streptomyces]|uniref:NmrA family NAD(P)-binding protein n=1 Tax=unclassified Streptomyces TaxID=2593676 RepID=UPI0033B6A8C2
MTAHATSTIFVVGGTGAQGMPVVRALVADKKYSVKVLTRDAGSPRAQALLALGDVSVLVEEWFRREGQLGRELGKGSLWERVQPENWSMDSAILKSSADFRTGKL